MSRQRRDLEAEFERLAHDGYCADPVTLARQALLLLTPPERISTTDCAAQHRLIPNPEGGARLWSPTLTPYINGIQDAMDNPLVKIIAVPKPARTGGTVAAENWLFKRLKFGPIVDVLWYMPGALVDGYVDTTVTPFFDLHPDVAAKLGPRPTDRKRKFKRIAGKVLEYLAANLANVRGKQAPIIIADELDGYPKALRASFRQQMGFRGRAYGNLAKGYICSHPDAGWTDGVASIWQTSNRGLWYWPCPHCSCWASPCPTAEWRMKLDWTRGKGMRDDDMLDHVEATACLICPHCGAGITDDHKGQMLLAGRWVFEGQVIAPDGTIEGAPRANDTWGFWIHGTMSPFVSWNKLAREYVAALVFFERSGNASQLREVTAKSLGEVYEGPSGRKADVRMLRGRMAEATTDDDDGYRAGEVPAGVRFITATVDVGGNKFDVAWIGWGADRESWLIDRQTLVAAPDGTKLQPPLRQDHWDVLRTQVLGRVFPLRGRPGLGLGVASMAYDTGGAPGTTNQAREFARRMALGPCGGNNAYRLWPIKGAAKKTAPEVGIPRVINRDDQGKPLKPPVHETDLGVFELKKIITDRMAIEAPGPGFMHLPRGGDTAWAEELTNESLIDGEWVRRGPNETLDLYVYAEAVRQILKPDRPEINWDRPPPWARPVPLKTETAAAAPPSPERDKEARRQALIERISPVGR